MDKRELGDAKRLWLPTAWRIQNYHFAVRIICSRMIYTESEYFYTRPHTHDFFEVQYITEGVAEFETGVNHFTLNKGMLIVYAPETVHRNVSVSSGTVKFGFAFYLDRVSAELEAVYQKMEVLKSSVWVGGPRMALLIALIQEYFSSPNGLLYDEIFLRLTEFFLISLFECIGGEDCPNDSSQIAFQIKKQAESMDSSIIQKIKKYISLNADHGVTITEIAKSVGFCSKHLNRIVRRELNCNVKDLITEARIAYIRQLLKDRYQTLEGVAIQSGFTSSSTMSVYFKRMTGETPTAYRARIGFKKLI